jgi:hypothetical protein
MAILIVDGQEIFVEEEYQDVNSLLQEVSAGKPPFVLELTQLKGTKRSPIMISIQYIAAVME